MRSQRSGLSDTLPSQEKTTMPNLEFQNLELASPIPITMQAGEWIALLGWWDGVELTDKHPVMAAFYNKVMEAVIAPSYMKAAEAEQHERHEAANPFAFIQQLTQSQSFPFNPSEDEEER
jgi:hypothetical protein